MKILTVLLAFAAVACVGEPTPEKPKTYKLDQCLRREVFLECMKALPKGPVSTQYNDWDEVVQSCAAFARNAAYRLQEYVPMKCRSR